MGTLNGLLDRWQLTCEVSRRRFLYAIPDLLSKKKGFGSLAFLKECSISVKFSGYENVCERVDGFTAVNRRDHFSHHDLE